MFVTTFHIRSDDDYTLRAGEITFGRSAPTPRFVKTSATCPFCGAGLERAMNAARLKIHRVAKVLGPERRGQRPFLGSLFPSRTHEFMGCRSCRIGFSTLKARR